MNARKHAGSLRKRAETYFGRINRLVSGPMVLMEVCGTHTSAVSRSGLRARLPDLLRLVPGLGSAMCVTPREPIDQAIAMACEPGVTIATFGDMMRLLGSDSSLEKERAAGRDVRIVYSPFDALLASLEEPSRTFVLLGIGFETTAAAVAATIVRASLLGARNFFVIPAFKRVPPAMEAMLARGAPRIDGFLCPGHVSAVIGSEPFRAIVSAHGIPCVITGFEPLDILEGIVMLLEQKIRGRAEVEVEYRCAVPVEGNRAALSLMTRVFRLCDAAWRGIGTIPGSGLEFSSAFARFDARRRLPVITDSSADEPESCACGDVISGMLDPPECPLFGKVCVPENPVGPCMVMHEGECAVFFNHGGRKENARRRRRLTAARGKAARPRLPPPCPS